MASNVSEDEDDSPIIQALKAAIASGELEANPTGWLEEASKRALNQELEDADDPLQRLEELVAEFRANGVNSSLAAQQAAKTWAATSAAREALREAVQAIPDAPPPRKPLWRRIVGR